MTVAGYVGGRILDGIVYGASLAIILGTMFYASLESAPPEYINPIVALDLTLTAGLLAYTIKRGVL